MNQRRGRRFSKLSDDDDHWAQNNLLKSGANEKHLLKPGGPSKRQEASAQATNFNSTSRYLDDLLNIDNPYFEGKVNQIYPPELQLNKAYTTDTETPFLDLHLSIANGFVSSRIYDKRDDFDFDIVNFLFLDGDVPRRASYGVYISQLIRFARVCNRVADFNARNKCLTAKLLQQGYRYNELRKTFS